MSYVKALDVSRWQGDINWNAVKNDGYEIAVIKVSGGDDGLYIDSKAGQNFNGAQAQGFALGTYHFAGGTDPVHEAEFFVRTCSPLDENQVMVLDWEVSHDNPVGWVQTFVNRVHEITGVWCIVYMNGSTLNSQDWSPVTANCGIWVAWYGRDPEQDLPVKYPYIMHQFTSTGSVPGIAGNVDLDAWYYDIATWNKYGYHAPTAPEPPKPVEPTPEPTKPVEPPVEPPKPVTPIEPPKPVEPPVVNPTPVVIHTSSEVHVHGTKQSWFVRMINAILYFFDFRVKKP